MAGSRKQNTFNPSGTIIADNVNAQRRLAILHRHRVVDMLDVLALQQRPDQTLVVHQIAAQHMVHLELAVFLDLNNSN